MYNKNELIQLLITEVEDDYKPNMVNLYANMDRYEFNTLIKDIFHNHITIMDNYYVFK